MQACNLQDKTCVPCEGGTVPLAHDEIQNLLHEVSGWQVKDDTAIEKDIKFKSFKEAVDFINKIASIAEAEGHHPDIFLHNWNKVRFTLSTHAIKGLSENDFILAAKIDQALALR